jgi:NTE family protein
LEKFAKFPISTNFEHNEPRLLLVAADVQEAVAVVFDSYEKEDGTRKSQYGMYGKLKINGSTEDQPNNDNNKGFEHVIRYDDGIQADFVMASCSVPVNYDYTRLNVENYSIVGEDNNAIARSGDISSNGSTSVRFFWDGGLLANTPLRETVLAHRQYWYRVKKLEENIPRLKFAIINLHPAKQEHIPYDYDRVIDRKNDIIYHDRTQFDEYVTILISDYTMLAKSIIKLAEENGVSKKKLQQILQEDTRTVNPRSGEQLRYDDLLKARIDVDFVVRMERKNDIHTISSLIFLQLQSEN